VLWEVHTAMPAVAQLTAGHRGGAAAAILDESCCSAPTQPYDAGALQGPNPLPVSLRMAVTAAHSANDVSEAAEAVRSAAQRVLSPTKRASSLQPQTSATL
jgi:hypothetical protein